MGARFGAAVLMAGLATPALAAGVLPIEGIYGNEAGCRYFQTGEPPAGDYTLLTADTFASNALACDFEALAARTQSMFIVASVCSPGGEMTLDVADRGPAGFLLRSEGREFGPLAPCPAPAGADTVQL